MPPPEYNHKFIPGNAVSSNRGSVFLGVAQRRFTPGTSMV